MWLCPQGKISLPFPSPYIREYLLIRSSGFLVKIILVGMLGVQCTATSEAYQYLMLDTIICQISQDRYMLSLLLIVICSPMFYGNNILKDSPSKLVHYYCHSIGSSFGCDIFITLLISKSIHK